MRMDAKNLAWTLVITVIASILFEIIRNIFFNRKAKLVHNFSSVFSYEIKGVEHFFTTLTIKNLGKLTAKNLNVSLDEDCLANVETNVKSNEIYEEKKHGEKYFYKFERLLSSDKIELIFRKEAERFTPVNLIIRSDEIESLEEMSIQKTAIGSSLLSTFISVAAVATFFTASQSLSIYKLFTKNPKEIIHQVTQPVPKLDIFYSANKTEFKIKDKLNFKILIKNPSKEIIRDIEYSVRIPGTDYFTMKKKDFLKPAESYTIDLDIPKDMSKNIPAGDNFIEFKMWAKTKNDTIFNNETYDFKVND